MNDNQENRLSMYEKVHYFLITNAAALASVTQIATIETALEDNIEDIIDADIIATGDDTGYTDQKSGERTDLESITLKVARALTAYYQSTGNTAALKMTDYTQSELDAKRDNDMYAAAKRLWTAADPVGASLTGFNSGPSDVTDLNTKMEAFFTSIPTPKSRQAARVAAGKDVDRLMKATDELLESLDTYVATFASGNITMYNEYLGARAIDDTGGGSSNVRRSTINPQTIRNVTYGASQIVGGTVLEFSNTGTSDLVTFYFSSAPASIYVDGPKTELAPGASIQKTATEAGFTDSKPKLNVLNPSTTLGKWRVKIISQP